MERVVKRRASKSPPRKALTQRISSNLFMRRVKPQILRLTAPVWNGSQTNLRPLSGPRRDWPGVDKQLPGHR